MTIKALADENAARPSHTTVVWTILAFIVAMFVIVQDASGLAERLNHRAGYGDDLGFAGAGCDWRGDCVVGRVAKDSVADRAGIRPGDIVHYDHRVDCCRDMRAGEAIGVTVHRAAQAQHLILVTRPRPWTASNAEEMPATFFYYGGCLVMALVGAFVIVRSRGQTATLLLGLAIACNGLHGAYIHLWQTNRMVYPFFMTAIELIFSYAPALFVLFAWRFRAETNGRDGPLIRGLAAALSFLTLVPAVMNLAGEIFGVIFGNDRLLTQIVAASSWINLGAALAILVMAWWEAPRQSRNRYRVMLAAIGMIMGQQLFGLLINLTGNVWRLENPLLIALVFCQMAGPLLFAYVVLRHRVLDLGFAINQTLVYGVVSFVVLLLFGLAEWGIEKILPREWAEANAVVSAMIALAIFLTFHRIRDLVEHVIEGLFFHKWRANESKLERFVKQAAHIVKPDALKAAAVAEFVRFSGGAEVAIYRADQAGFARDAGALTGLADQLDTDLAPLVELRAEGKPLFDTDAAELHAALVLPMVQRNDLTGFVALGAKPSGEAWRPDERAVLAAAAQAIGADLHALKIEELRQERDLAARREAVLTARLDIALKAAGLAE